MAGRDRIEELLRQRQEEQTGRMPAEEPEEEPEAQAGNRMQAAPERPVQIQTGMQNARPEGMQSERPVLGDYQKPRQQVIGQEQVREARKTMLQYKAGKANLERRVIDNEEWYRLRHWECLRKRNTGGVEPTSGWLFNALANKHADAMDNFPAPNILPREAGDKAEAEKLTSIIPVVLERNDFEEVYDEAADTKLKAGTAIYGVFWNPDELGGIGDISVKCIDILNLFWEPGVKDIQDSRNVFHAELMDKDLIEEQYPQCKGKLGNDVGTIERYIQDESVDLSGKAAVIDWYYHKNGRLHYCKFVDDVVLFATENEAEYAEDGWYDHGRYPFVFDPLFRQKDSPAGFGYIDVAKSAQEYIDRGNQAVLQNMLANARPRHFIRSDGSVNEEEYGDYTKDFVHVDGAMGQDSILPIQGKPLNGIYMQIIDAKINELKEVTGNRDISTGGSQAGVTAASAIAAMQEAGSKLSRDNNKSSYRAFRKVCWLIVELIRQFYSLPRCFRIMGKEGQEKFTTYTNEGIQPSAQGQGAGSEDGMRVPQFDIEITAQKQSPYSKMSQNELALQFYGAGFFNPQMADQALACLDMMDFDRKNFIIEKVQQNGTMFQQIQMMQQQILGMANQLDQLQGTNYAQQMMQQMGGGAPAPMMQGAPSAEGQAALGAEPKAGESKGTKNARERVANSTDPG